MRKNRSRRPRRPFNAKGFLRFLVVILILGSLFFYLRDLRAPQLTVTPAQGTISAKRPVVVTVSDSGTGLKAVRIVARQSGKETILGEKAYHGEPTAELAVAPETLNDGPLELLVTARDQALFPFGNGNSAQQRLTLSIDRTPPQIELLSPATPIWQGGAATIAYKVSEETAKSGVEAGELFFAGYRQANGVYLCVVPYPVAATNWKPKLLAVDVAGNETRASAGLQLISRPFPTAKIPVTDAFIAAKTEEFQESAPDASGIELFLKMNRDVRAANRKKLIELAAQSATTPLWSEAMLRMPRAKTTGAYAEARDYIYNGRIVDHQTHLGTDLASVAQAPILAANPGKVVFAGYFGIYGGCVVIDHGLGVQTLYGHLSNVSTQVGKSVTRGEEIGRSGKTGMSGGDHLHFEVMVGGVPVRPEEWMEKGWMETNILGPMRGR